MDFNKYQEQAITTAIYPKEERITYPLLGLIGEVGEFANKYKKVLRDGKPFTHADKRSELGDILWYLNALIEDCDLTFNEVAHYNLTKLFDRQERGVLGGSGDNR